MTLDQPHQSLVSLKAMRGDPSDSRLKIDFDTGHSNQMHNTESRLRDAQLRRQQQDPNSISIKIKKKSKLPVGGVKKTNRQRFKPVGDTSMQTKPKIPKSGHSFINQQKNKSPVQFKTPPSHKLVLGAVRNTINTSHHVNHNTNSYSSKSLSRSFTQIPCTSPENPVVSLNNDKWNDMQTIANRLSS